MAQHVINVKKVVLNVMLLIHVLYVKMKTLKNQTVAVQLDNIKKGECVKYVKILPVKHVKEQKNV